jgi:hypothetical protein
MRDPGWQQDLVERLVADGTPVRRLWRPELRLLAWLAVGIPLVVFPMSRVLRDDVVQQLRTPAFLLEEATMLVAAALLALAALRAAVPGRRVGAAISLAAAALALGSLLVLSKPIFTSWTPDVFLAVGLPCLWRSFAWTMVPWALLVIAVRRAAPLRSRWTGALVGAAAWGLTFGALRLCCQTEELMHLGVFHVLPFVTGTVLSGALGPVLFRDPRA